MKETDLAPRPGDQDPKAPTPAPAPSPASARPALGRSQGKIALLPHDLREQLNQRLRDGHRVADLRDWLNSLPQTRQVLDAHFAGKPVSVQNVYGWRSGPHQQWLKARQEFEHTAEFAARSLELANTTGASLTEVSATMFLSKLLARLEQSDLASYSVRELLDLSKVIIAFRKGDPAGEVVRLAREQLQVQKARLEQSPSPAEPLPPPTREQVELIERALHI